MTDEIELEQEPSISLAEIIDQDSLQRVCMTYARMYSTGLAVVDSRGQVLVDIPAQYPLCRRISAHPAGPAVCGGFYIIQTQCHTSQKPPRALISGRAAISGEGPSVQSAILIMMQTARG